MTIFITISLAAVLLASQIAVIIALIVLYKKFKALEVKVNKYRIKKNKDALPMLTVRRPTAEKNRPKNEYVDGQRNPSTLVKSNSQESIVYVPSPSERGSKSYDSNDEEATKLGMSDMQNSTNEAATPNIKEININVGYMTDDSDEAEIYGNQVIVDMVENDKVTKRSECGTQLGSADGCSTKNLAQKEKSQRKTVRGSQNVIYEHEQTSFESESTIVGGEWFGVGQDSQDSTDAPADEPIYENVKRNSALRKS